MSWKVINFLFILLFCAKSALSHVNLEFKVVRWDQAIDGPSCPVVLFSNYSCRPSWCDANDNLGYSSHSPRVPISTSHAITIAYQNKEKPTMTEQGHRHGNNLSRWIRSLTDLARVTWSLMTGPIFLGPSHWEKSPQLESSHLRRPQDSQTPPTVWGPTYANH